MVIDYTFKAFLLDEFSFWDRKETLQLLNVGLLANASLSFFRLMRFLKKAEKEQEENWLFVNSQ